MKQDCQGDHYCRHDKNLSCYPEFPFWILHSSDISNLALEFLLQRYPPPAFPVRGPPRRPRKPVCALLGPSTLGMAALAPSSWTLLPPPTLAASVAAVKALLSRWHRQCRKPPHNHPEQSPRQVSLRQQQPVIPRMLHEPPARFHQPLLQTRQRPRVNSLRHGEPPPQVPKIVGDDAQGEPHLVRPKPVAAQPRHLHGQFAFLDPLFCSSSLVVEAHHRPAVRLQGRHDEAHQREQFPAVEFYLRHDPPRRRPTRSLVPEASVPDHRLVPGSAHRPRQQLRDLPLQNVIGWDADSVLHIPSLQGLVDLRFGEGGIGADDHVLALLLLPLDLRQKHLIPVRGAVNVARSQLGCQAVALPIEQQQR